MDRGSRERTAPKRQLAGVKRMPLRKALKAATTHQEDFVLPYVRGSQRMSWTWTRSAAQASSWASIRLGGAAVPTGSRSTPFTDWTSRVVNPAIDPTFSFMTVDHDGKIRMDCSSPYAMAGLVGLKDEYQVAFANDPDSDRHGIVTPSAGLMNPNHYLAVAIRLSAHEPPGWRAERRSARRWSAAA